MPYPAPGVVARPYSALRKALPQVGQKRYPGCNFVPQLVQKLDTPMASRSSVYISVASAEDGSW